MSVDLIKKVNILGVVISAIAMGDAVEFISAWINDRKRHYVNVCTVHTIMECLSDPELQLIINRSGMATPDGMPLVWLSHLHGFQRTERVYGPDLMLAVCAHSIERGYRHYFYGGVEGVAEKLSQNLSARFPGLQIAGFYSPPFRPPGAIEESRTIDRINAAKPDIVWVGLGTPKQDYWVAKHRSVLDASVIIAVGAAFDFHTNRIPQAPKWMQHNGLEWVFRMLVEPRRLAYRYIVYNPLFIMHTFLQLSGIKHYDISE